MVVVFNSSPWVFLSKLELIETAIDLFSKVFIPSSSILRCSEGGMKLPVH